LDDQLKKLLEIFFLLPKSLFIAIRKDRGSLGVALSASPGVWYSLVAKLIDLASYEKK
jgi:hypothetical protein